MKKQIFYWDDDKLVDYIINFLLPIDCWMIIEYMLTQISPLDKKETKLKNGFIWHVWILPNDLLIKINKQRNKERNKNL